MSPATRTLVPVAGGALTVATWDGADATPVLAVHGITASHLAWAEVAARHPGPFHAPDLRGRGGSAALPGPYGLAAHARDCVAALDALGVDRAVVVGHSMGAFVAAALAYRHPDRVERVVLVDGGAPLALPPGDPDQVLDAAIGPAVRRLGMRFTTREAYRTFWRAHPAFGTWTAAVEEYVDYDLTGEPPALRSKVSHEAVRADFADLSGADARRAFEAVAPETVFLRAERGLLDEPVPLYPRPADLAGRVRVRTVAGSNHYSILFGAAGADAIAAAL